MEVYKIEGYIKCKSEEELEEILFDLFHEHLLQYTSTELVVDKETLETSMKLLGALYDSGVYEYDLALTAIRYMFPEMSVDIADYLIDKVGTEYMACDYIDRAEILGISTSKPSVDNLDR